MTTTVTRSTPRKQHPWYSFDRLLSYNAVFNFCAGGRGIGKTYDAKRRVIRKALRKGEQFIYLRRYKEETQIARRTFFMDVSHEFPEYDFRVNSWEAQVAPISTREDKKRPWATIGYFISLSQAQNVKSGSFHSVTTIIFDEFIVEPGRIYLRDEANIFLGFYSTVDRNQDKTIVLFCANSVSIMNPYFTYFDIRPDILPELSSSHKGYIACHFPDSEQFKKSIYDTRFGKFIQGTEFGEYAVENQFNDNGESLIDIKPSTARHHFNLETKYGTVSIWFERKSQTYYVQRKLPKDSVLDLTLMPEKMEPGKQLVSFTNPLLQYLRAAFNSGRVYFDRPSTRNAFAEISKR